MVSSPYSSDHVLKVLSAALKAPLVGFWLLFNFSAVAKWCPKRSDSFPEVQKPVLPSQCGNEVAPMNVFIHFLEVFGSVLAGFGSRFCHPFFLNCLVHDVSCAVWTVGNITYIYGGQNYLQLLRNAPNLASREVQVV